MYGVYIRVKTRQSYTIENAITKIVRHIVILSVAWKSCCTVRFDREEVHKNTDERPKNNVLPTLAGLYLYAHEVRHKVDAYMVTSDLTQHTHNWDGSTIRKLTLKHTASKETSSTDYTVNSLMCVSAAEHHTSEQYP